MHHLPPIRIPAHTSATAPSSATPASGFRQRHQPVIPGRITAPANPACYKFSTGPLPAAAQFRSSALRLDQPISRPYHDLPHDPFPPPVPIYPQIPALPECSTTPSSNSAHLEKRFPEFSPTYRKPIGRSPAATAGLSNYTSSSVHTFPLRPAPRTNLSPSCMPLQMRKSKMSSYLGIPLSTKSFTPHAIIPTST